MTHFRYVHEHAARIATEFSEAALVAVIEHLYHQAFGRLGTITTSLPAPASSTFWPSFDRDLQWAKIDPDLAARRQQICGEVIARLPEDTAQAQPGQATPRL